MRFQTQTLFINASNLKCKTSDFSAQWVLLKFCKIFYVLVLMSRQETPSNNFQHGLSGYRFDKEKVKKGCPWFRRGYRSILKLIKEFYFSLIRVSTSPLSVDHRPRRLHKHVPDLLCNTREDNHWTSMWRLVCIWLNRLLYTSFFVLCSVSVGDSSASQHTAFCASVAPNPIGSQNVNIGRLCKTLVCGKRLHFWAFSDFLSTRRISVHRD